MKDFASKENLIPLLRSLVEIESPYFHEENVMHFVHDWLSAHNLPARIHTFHEEKITDFHGMNVVGCLDSGKPGPTIYLGGHLDTVKLCDGWTRPPFEGVVEGNRMYGVGALDMKSGDAAIMLALDEFNRNYGDSFKGKIIYQFASDEEGPFGLGTVALIEENMDGIRDGVDFAIIAEPSAGFTATPHPCICPGAKGGYNYTITIHGVSTHAATPELGVNALVDAGRVMVELENIQPVVDEKLGPSALCVINLTTRGNAASVPDYAQIEIFHHTVRGETPSTMRSAIEDAIRRANIRSTWELTFRDTPANPEDGFDGGFMPYCTDEEDPHIKTLSESIRTVCGTEPNISYFQSIGDFNHIGGLLGIPTVLMGADGSHFHGADEYVDLDSACEITHIIYDFLTRTNAIG